MKEWNAKVGDRIWLHRGDIVDVVDKSITYKIKFSDGTESWVTDGSINHVWPQKDKHQ